MILIHTVSIFFRVDLKLHEIELDLLILSSYVNSLCLANCTAVECTIFKLLDMTRPCIRFELLTNSKSDTTNISSFKCKKKIITKIITKKLLTCWS